MSFFWPNQRLKYLTNSIISVLQSSSLMRNFGYEVQCKPNWNIKRERHQGKCTYRHVKEPSATDFHNHNCSQLMPKHQPSVSIAQTNSCRSAAKTDETLSWFGALFSSWSMDTNPGRTNVAATAAAWKTGRVSESRKDPEKPSINADMQQCLIDIRHNN